MAEGEKYFLGYRQAEQQRLQYQAEQLGPESARLFDEIGLSEGARVLEIGCGPRGCLDLLSERVGLTGSVVGVEISEAAVGLARDYVVEHELSNVEVVRGDARSTGLRSGSFDAVTARLVLVNVPSPDQIIAEAVRLARPGGAIAFHEVDWAAMVCDPPSQAWTGIVDLILDFTEKNGNDFFVGRKLPRLLRDAGLTEVHVNPIVHAHPPGDPRRTLLLDFADNLRERIIGQGLIADDELTDLKDALARHLDDPATAVFMGPYVQAWGRTPL